MTNSNVRLVKEDMEELMKALTGYHNTIQKIMGLIADHLDEMTNEIRDENKT